jgi:hypothetical protein
MKKLLLILLFLPMIGFGQDILIPGLNFNTDRNSVLLKSMYLEILDLEKKSGNLNCDSISFSEYEFDVGGTDTKWGSERARTVKYCYFDKGYSKITFYKADIREWTLAEFYFRYNRLFFAYTRTDFEVEYGDPSQFEPDFSEPEPQEYYFYDNSSNVKARSKILDSHARDLLETAQESLKKYGEKSIQFTGEFDEVGVAGFDGEYEYSVKETFGINMIEIKSICDVINAVDRLNNAIINKYKKTGSFTVDEIETIISLQDYLIVIMEQVKISNNPKVDISKNCPIYEKALMTLRKYHGYKKLPPGLLTRIIGSSIQVY